MTFHDRRNRSANRLTQALVLLGCLSVTAYFAYHALYGRYGLEARARLLERDNLLEFEIASLASVRGKLERDVALLSPELPNPDLVEEIARDVLGYVHPNDLVLMTR